MMKTYVLALMLCVSGFAKADVIDLAEFQVGAYWTWAYSESADGVWQEPYLYETYQVTQTLGSYVKVEMSSGPSLTGVYQAPHYFIVDLEACQSARHSLGKLGQLKLQFYTRSSGAWEKLSSRHDGLAFTEKFNCLEAGVPKKNKAFELKAYGLVSLFQWQGIFTQSWYDQADGIAKLRFSGAYKMELVSKGKTL